MSTESSGGRVRRRETRNQYDLPEFAATWKVSSPTPAIPSAGQTGAKIVGKAKLSQRGLIAGCLVFRSLFCSVLFCGGRGEVPVSLGNLKLQTHFLKNVYSHKVLDKNKAVLSLWKPTEPGGPNFV